MEKIERKPEDMIRKSERLIRIYGRWPSFHDFEITRIQFDRNTPKNEHGPYISVFVHMWAISGKTSDRKKYIFENHNTIEFLMRNVYEYDIKGFNCQNVIDDIQTWQEKDGNLIKSCIHFPSIYGVDLVVRCQTIEIGTIEPGIPIHSVYDIS